MRLSWWLVLLPACAAFAPPRAALAPPRPLAPRPAVVEAVEPLAEPLRYAFMLPTATLVATSCQLAGIGGAALFAPIFLLGFPLLGPEYPLDSAAASIASALLTEVFGFSSGLTGYARRGLVDWRVSAQFASVSVPFAFAGAVAAGPLSSNVQALRLVYAILMLSIATYLARTPSVEALSEEECIATGTQLLTKVDTTGRTFTYQAPQSGSVKSSLATGAGGALTGLLGVGVGETLLPQLVRGCCMAQPVAAGTSVATVVITAAAAAVIQFNELAATSGGDIVSVIPWDLVRWTIPGVLVGGQLAPLIASRGYIDDEAIETGATILFAVVGLAFLAKGIGG